MISKKLALEFNKIISNSSGGSSGLRDETLLSSALNRPFQTFDGNDLYPTIIDKSAALFQSIIINHPFIDGNKLMAYAFMIILLTENGVIIEASLEEKYNFVMEAAEGKLGFENIKDWIKKNVSKV